MDYKALDILGATSEKAALLQSQLDARYGAERYTVQSDTLTANDGIIKHPEGNDIGVCAEPNAVATACGNSSPITGASTVSRGDNPYPIENGYGNDEMKMCDVCEKNKDIYNNVATGGQNESK